jgi:hypothetical protein
MNLLAKNILPEKFWIIEDESNTKLGTIQVGPQRVKVVLDGGNYIYADFDSALSSHDILTSTDPINETKVSTHNVNEYPAKDQPFNEMYDAMHGLPMYTKTEKSKCFYAAGYYIIHFNFAWAPAYCPKVITLNRNEFRGPYKTEIEMKEQLRLHNGRNKD